MRVEVLYDDGSTVAFNTPADAILQLYQLGVAGVVCLREEADWEQIGRVRAAVTAMSAAGIPVPPDLPSSDPPILMDREQINAAVAALRDDPDIPPVREGSRTTDPAERRTIIADNAKALEAVTAQVRENAQLRRFVDG